MGNDLTGKSSAFKTATTTSPILRCPKVKTVIAMHEISKELSGRFVFFVFFLELQDL